MILHDAIVGGSLLVGMIVCAFFAGVMWGRNRG